MRMLWLTTAIAAVLGFPGLASASDWSFDKDHTQVGFTVRHLGVSNVTGEFEEASGKVTIPDGEFTKGSVEVTIAVKSVNTRVEKRDEHLRSGAFFQADKYPNITFKSKKIKKVGKGGDYQIIGDLTIRGITKEVTLAATLTEPVSAWGTRRGLSGSVSVNRQDFKVSWNKTFDKGIFAVANQVEIWFQVELLEEQPEKKKEKS